MILPKLQRFQQKVANSAMSSMSPTSPQSIMSLQNVGSDKDKDKEEDVTSRSSIYSVSNQTVMSPLKGNYHSKNFTTIFESIEEAQLTGDAMQYEPQSENVVYEVTKINRWGKHKSRTMVISLNENHIRLFDEKRKCHSEYDVSIMATMEYIDSTTLELIFISPPTKESKDKHRPCRLVFQSKIDLWHFVEQVQHLNRECVFLEATKSEKNKKMEEKQGGKKINYIYNNDNDSNDNNNNNHIYNDDTDISELLRFSVLRLVRTKQRQNKYNLNDASMITWRQHRRLIYLDLKRKIVRMMTLGSRLKDYPFSDIILVLLPLLLFFFFFFFYIFFYIFFFYSDI